MPTLARPLVRQARLQRQAGKRAFTLIELLTVIAIIAILAGITFGVVKGVNERAAIGQAKVELSVLSQALEAYKMQYGDYPRTTDKAVFYRALIGLVGPKGDPITGSGAGRKFIETGKFSLNTLDPDASGNYLLDPWGRQYNYYYKPNSTWTSPYYVLMSAGPNGYLYGTTAVTGAHTSLLNANGTFKSDAGTEVGAADNIYANK